MGKPYVEKIRRHRTNYVLDNKIIAFDDCIQYKPIDDDYWYTVHDAHAENVHIDKIEDMQHYRGGLVKTEHYPKEING